MLNNLIIIAPGNHLLAGGPEYHSVLELGGVAALGVAERGVGVHEPLLTEVPQSQQVLGLPHPVHPPAAERQGAEVLVNHSQQLLRLVQPKKWLII